MSYSEKKITNAYKNHDSKLLNYALCDGLYSNRILALKYASNLCLNEFKENILSCLSDPIKSVVLAAINTLYYYPISDDENKLIQKSLTEFAKKTFVASLNNEKLLKLISELDNLQLVFIYSNSSLSENIKVLFNDEIEKRGGYKRLNTECEKEIVDNVKNYTDNQLLSLYQKYLQSDSKIIVEGLSNEIKTRGGDKKIKQNISLTEKRAQNSKKLKKTIIYGLVSTISIILGVLIFLYVSQNKDNWKYDEIKNSNDISVYEEFIRIYPHSELLSKVIQKRDYLRLVETIEKNNVDSLTVFISAAKHIPYQIEAQIIKDTLLLLNNKLLEALNGKDKLWAAQSLSEVAELYASLAKQTKKYKEEYSDFYYKRAAYSYYKASRFIQTEMISSMAKAFNRNVQSETFSLNSFQEDLFSISLGGNMLKELYYKNSIEYFKLANMEEKANTMVTNDKILVFDLKDIDEEWAILQKESKE